jgi:glutamine amidotransferase
MIRIIDYGLGNSQAFMNVYKSLDLPVGRAQTVDELADARRLILPGVGAFDHAINLFNRSGMRDKIEQMVFDQKIPLLGVCVGMQMLASKSDEGVMPGLNWIPGSVRSFASNTKDESLTLPHMGWNDLDIKSEGKLLSNLSNSPRFYFLHSYYYDCDDKSHVAANTDYSFHFNSVISRSNINGVQFHPEKSHKFGAQLLKNFAEL